MIKAHCIVLFPCRRGRDGCDTFCSFGKKIFIVSWANRRPRLDAERLYLTLWAKLLCFAKCSIPFGKHWQPANGKQRQSWIGAKHDSKRITVLLLLHRWIIDSIIFYFFSPSTAWNSVLLGTFDDVCLPSHFDKSFFFFSPSLKDDECTTKEWALSSEVLHFSNILPSPFLSPSLFTKENFCSVDVSLASLSVSCYSSKANTRRWVYGIIVASCFSFLTFLGRCMHRNIPRHTN